MYAAQHRALNAVRMLKDRGADVNILDSSGFCALHAALYSKDQAVIEELIPTVLPTQSVLPVIAMFKPKISGALKKFIYRVVYTGWCLETICVIKTNIYIRGLQKESILIRHITL